MSVPADLTEVIADLEEQRIEAKKLGRMVNEAALLGDLLERLAALEENGNESGGRELSTSQVADRRSVVPETVARWCRQGRFPNAEKTGENGGEWRIPKEESMNSSTTSRTGTEDRKRFQRKEERTT